MTRVLATGTFDLLHKGHQDFLRQAKSLGTELVVVIARDDTVKKVKGRESIHDEATRRLEVSLLPMVDQAVLGHKGDKYKIIEECKPDIIALGYDQSVFTHKLQEELQKRGLHPRITRLEAFHPEKYKSSLLREARAQTRL